MSIMKQAIEDIQAKDGSGLEQVVMLAMETREETVPKHIWKQS